MTLVTWVDISSAPPFGHLILLFGHLKHYNYPQIVIGSRESADKDGNHYKTDNGKDFVPSHWMALPEQPEIQKIEKQKK